jgi:hypothetical protein
MDLVSMEGQEENNIVFRLIQQGQLHCVHNTCEGALSSRDVTVRTLLHDGNCNHHTADPVQLTGTFLP